MLDPSVRCNPCATTEDGRAQLCPATGKECTFNDGTCYTVLNNGTVECVTPCDSSGPSGQCRECEPIERETSPSTCIRRNPNFPENINYCCSDGNVDGKGMCVPDWENQAQRQCPQGYEWNSRAEDIVPNGRSCNKCPSGITDANRMCVGAAPWRGQFY